MKDSRGETLLHPSSLQAHLKNNKTLHVFICVCVGCVGVLYQGTLDLVGEWLLLWVQTRDLGQHAWKQVLYLLGYPISPVHFNSTKLA